MADAPSFLTLKQSNGDSHRVEIDVATATVLELKLSVQAKLQFPPESQRLIFQGRVMDDKQPLTFYSLASGLTVHLVVNTKLVPSAPTASPTVLASAVAPPSAAPPATTTLLQQLPLLRAQPGGPAAIATLKKMAENIVANPTEQKYMKIRLNNEALKRKILDVPHGLQCVQAMGFAPGVEEGHLVIVPTAANWDLVVASKRTLDQFDASHQFAGAPAQPFGSPFPSAAPAFGSPMGGMSPESLLAMMDNPMFAQMLASDPRLQQMAQTNPMLQQALQNPALLRQSLQAVQSDPHMRQQMQQMMANPQQMQQMMANNPMYGGGAANPFGGGFGGFGAPTPPAPAAPSPFGAPVSLTSQPVPPPFPAVPRTPPAPPAAPPAPRSEEDEIAEAIARSLREM